MTIPPCYCCGGNTHMTHNYKDQICHHCGKQGHIQRVCRSKQQGKPKQATKTPEQGSTFRKKSWGQLASKFSFLVARTSILVAKNYLQEKIAYNILKVFLTSTKSSISYLLQNRLHNPYNGTCYNIHFYAFMYSVTVKITDS